MVQAHPNHGTADISIILIGSWRDQGTPEEFVIRALRIKNNLGHAVLFRGIYSVGGQEMQIYKMRNLLGVKSWAAVNSLHILPGEDKIFSYPEYRIKPPLTTWKGTSPGVVAFFDGLSPMKVLVITD